jgi:hypothetical protein
MLTDLLKNDDEKAILVGSAAVALHGLLAGGSRPDLATVRQAFEIAEIFLAEALRRV